MQKLFNLQLELAKTKPLEVPWVDHKMAQEIKDLRKEVHKKLQKSQTKNRKKLLKQKVESKKSSNLWLPFDEYQKKIAATDWTDLSNEEHFMISNINGRYYVSAASMTEFKNAVQSVVAKSKQLGIPHPKLQPHPDFADKIFSRMGKIGKKEEKSQLSNEKGPNPSQK